MVGARLQTLWAAPEARLVVFSAVLAILTVVGWYVVLRFRGGVDESETMSDHLAKFREMRQQGYLREAEFRKLKTHLGERLQAELKQDEQGG